MSENTKNEKERIKVIRKKLDELLSNPETQQTFLKALRHFLNNKF